MTRVDLSIGELVLVDVDPRDRHRIADAVVRELAARVTADGLVRLARDGASLERLRGTDVRLPPGAGSRADALGRGVAISVAAALGGTGGAPGGRKAP